MEIPERLKPGGRGECGRLVPALRESHQAQGRGGREAGEDGVPGLTAAEEAADAGGILMDAMPGSSAMRP